MKVFFDPIYTSHVNRCASAYKMMLVATHLLSHNEDLFVYFHVPEDLSEEDAQYMQFDDRVQLVPYPYVTDRYKEYQRLYREYEMNFAFNGHYWDTDIIVTNRTTLIPLIKLLSRKHSQPVLAWTKKIILFEDMPQMTFKGSVALAHPETCNMQNALAYAVADKTFISAFWEKAEILKIAKDYFTPSMLARINKNMIEAVPHTVESFSLKSDAYIANLMEGKKRFTISFSGRLIAGHHFEDIFSIMEKNWIFRGGGTKLDCIVTTQSKGGSPYVDKPDFIDLRFADRAEFWNLLDTTIDIGIFLSEEEDYSLSMIEPLIKGVPVAILREKHSVASIGPDYPFFIDNTKQAHDIIKSFYEDYASMYALFREWHDTKFRPLLQERNSVYLPLLVQQEVDRWRADLALYAKINSQHADNDITSKLADVYADGQPHDMFEVIEKLGADGVLKWLDDKLDIEAERTSRKLAWTTNFNLFRLSLMAFYGVTDCGTTPGYLVQKKRPKASKGPYNGIDKLLLD